MRPAVVIGGGPAGLMAAGELACAGLPVLVAEAKPSLGRKLLMAGKSGLNLTKDEPFEVFMSAYGGAADWLRPMIAEFRPEQVRAWAESLGQEVFAGSTGRVFPKVMKASPLLRAWLGELAGQGVEVRTHWRWTGWQGEALVFETPDGVQKVKPSVTVLALGGASWRRLGSDGGWAELLGARGVPLAPFAPSNAAVAVDWSVHMRAHFGRPLKGVAFRCGDLVSRGEAVISARGLEGGGVYGLTPALRDGHPLTIDLMPDVDVETLAKRFTARKRKISLANWLKTSLRLPPAKTALFFEMAKAGALDTSNPVPLLKALPIRHAGLRPMDEAISTAGGIAREALDDTLMLKAMPGVFCAGEMLDWEAPTGGYLLTACLATGRWAGRNAAAWSA